jgi:hypothetical protein
MKSSTVSKPNQDTVDMVKTRVSPVSCGHGWGIWTRCPYSKIGTVSDVQGRGAPEQFQHEIAITRFGRLNWKTVSTRSSLASREGNAAREWGKG